MAEKTNDTPPRDRAANPPAKKLGEGVIRDMLARGADELAIGIGVHGHERAHNHAMDRGR